MTARIQPTVLIAKGEVDCGRQQEAKPDYDGHRHLGKPPSPRLKVTLYKLSADSTPEALTYLLTCSSVSSANLVKFETREQATSTRRLPAVMSCVANN